MELHLGLKKRQTRNKMEMEKDPLLENVTDEDEISCEILDEKEISGKTVVFSKSILLNFIQIFFPFILAGLGMVAAGLLLDRVQHWRVFVDISELFILVPALLGLKGNLEMTLASRLSTQAHLGKMDSGKDIINLVGSNLALVQVQGVVVGFIASIFAVIVAVFSRETETFSFFHSSLLCAASILTASIASFLLGLVMVFVILLSRKINVDPDNVATPIAASLGDLITLGLLSFNASFLYEHSTAVWLPSVIIVLSLLFLPLTIYFAKSNEGTSKVLISGWSPVICSMMISSLGGCILDEAVTKYKGIAVFQPVMNGVGGNLVAVQASKISTYLHTLSSPGVIMEEFKGCLSPMDLFFRNHPHSVTARILILMVIPGQSLFLYVISVVKGGHTSVTLNFTLVYLCAAILQIWILLHVAHVLIMAMWKRGIDPDNSAIPYLTALGDLLGTSFLFLAFHFLYMIGDKDSDVGDK